MSNRQARIARKQRQRDGIDAYVHVKPTSGTKPYETREQVQARRRIARAAQKAATEAAALAMRIGPAAREAILAGGKHFGDDAR